MTDRIRGIYIGIQTQGTTSQLRADTLKELLPNASWRFIDTDIPFLASRRIWKSLAFRLRTGPAVRAMNKHVLAQLGDERFDVAWIDKGVCLWPETIQQVRTQADRLIYYTPDTSFAENSSRFFDLSLHLYDVVATTKSFEMESFKRLLAPEKLLCVTQSFDRNLHFPRHTFREKRKEAVLIGLNEPDRENCVETLLEAGVPVAVGGKRWESFIDRHRNTPGFRFLGPAVFGEDYANALSEARIGLGLLTKRFSELHTTRTFEIPACGTVLATPQNIETEAFFDAKDVIFFKDHQQLAKQVLALMSSDDLAMKFCKNGQQAVRNHGYSNHDVLAHILEHVGLSPTRPTTIKPHFHQ